jgi:O-antigen/teichoic acid export membrane protein
LSSMTKRTIILMICRAANYSVLLFSPIFLVRILDVRSYGQYREFILYAMLISTIADFAIRNNLIFFIAKYPDLERKSVTHTALLILITSTIAASAVYLAKNLILARTSYDFIPFLMLYIFFYLNLDFYESYWIGKKRAQNVLVYSTGRVIIRMIAIIIVAYLTQDVISVIKVIISVEIAKCIFMFFAFRKFFTKNLDRTLLRKQLRYIVPLGFASNINYLNTHLARLLVSIKMGAESLAIYSIGSYQIPLISILRASIMDVLFPEMSERGDAERLLLWKRANVVFCSIVFPLFVVFFYYADTLVVTLFTREYAAAIPLFRVYLFLMVRQCFELTSPLRSKNKNTYFILGSILLLTVNIGLIILLFQRIGIIALPIAFVIGDVCMGIYLASIVMKNYRTSIGGLYMWKKIFSVLFEFDPVIKAIVFSLVYLSLYVFFVRKRRIEEVDLLLDKVSNRLRRAKRNMKE